MIATDRRVLARFSISRPDGVTWEDLTGYLTQATVSLGDVSSVGTGQAGIDERVRTAQFVLANDRTGQPAWPETVAREEAEVVGDELDSVGDEADGAEKLINLLLNTAHTFAPAPLSPRDRVSEWNQFGGAYAPLIWPRREVYFEVALYALGQDTAGTTTVRGEVLGTGDGATTQFATAKKPLVLAANVPVNVYLDGVLQGSGYTVNYDLGLITFSVAPPSGVVVSADYTYWLVLFHGLIDDWQTQGPAITIRCRDLAARLMDAYILTPREYGSEAGTPLETVVQAILDDHLGAGVVTLYCPVSPGFAVTPYVVEYQTVWEAIQTLAAKTVGWYLGYRWREATGRFELTLLEPPRSKDASTADWHLTWTEDIYVNDLGGSIADVRNKVLVVYRDVATGERATVTAEDAASQAEYGVRAMQIEEADASLIDTEAEALALAQAAIADLAQQHATTRLDLPLLPDLDLMHGITIEDPRTSSTTDFYAVESVEHRLDWSDPERAVFRTTAVCSGRVAGSHVRWLAMQTRPGSRGQPARPPTSQAVPAPPSNLRLVGSGLETVEQVTLAYLDLAWDPPANVVCDQYLLRWRKAGTSYWETVTVPRGTGAAPRRIGRLPGNVSYDIEVAGISRAGVQGQWSTTLAATTPKDSTAPGAPTGVTATGVIRGLGIKWDQLPEADYDHTEVHISTTSGFTPDRASWTTLKARVSGTAYEWTDGAVAGTTYYVRLVHVDTSGNASAASAEVSAVAGSAKAIDMDEALFYVIASDCAGYLSPGVWEVSLTGGAYQLAQTEDTFVYASAGQSASIRSYLGCSISRRPSFELHFRARLSGTGWECGLRGVKDAAYAVRSPFALVQPGTSDGTIKFITGSALSLDDAVTDNIGVDPTQWHTYVIRVDGGNKLFVDGVQVAWHSGAATHTGQVVFALAPASGSASLTLDYVVMKYTS